jgi:hypothetical protein
MAAGYAFLSVLIGAIVFGVAFALKLTFLETVAIASPIVSIIVAVLGGISASVRG